ncbi:MAG TPA: hypothetical protein VG942_01200 [Hyphomonadaceae bacterium]|nr:hypothetical protein [Hyphomonadaceae bacterium]
MFNNNNNKIRLGPRAAASAAILAIAIGAGAIALAPSYAQTGVAAAAQTKTAPITRGQKIVMATHSFNVFISTDPDRPTPTRTQVVQPGGAAAPAPAPGAPRPDPCEAANRASAGAPTGTPLLTKLSNEAGFTGQEFLAVQMIGGSTPKQHWDQCGGDETKNIAKAALIANGDKVDVFTMSPNAIMPEEGIDHFGDFVIAHNKNARMMVQNSWSAYDGHGSTPAVGGTGGGDFKNADRDNVKEAEVDGWITTLHAKGGYLDKMRQQLEGIDKRAGHQITYVVPSGDAVYELRKLVIEGKVPGIAKQSDMHRDPIGHPTTPTAHLVGYVWFTAMYRKSPVGLQALVDKNDPTSAKRERMLQEIAWNAVVAEPKSGVTGKPVKVE